MKVLEGGVLKVRDQRVRNEDRKCDGEHRANLNIVVRATIPDLFLRDQPSTHFPCFLEDLRGPGCMASSGGQQYILKRRLDRRFTQSQIKTGFASRCCHMTDVSHLSLSMT